MEHEHILSGILKCPVCGGAMYANVNRKKKKDGTFYRDFFYYACKHRIRIDGHNCDYHKQWGQDKVNAAVEEVIRKMVNNPKFQSALKQKIGSKIDTSELEKERDASLRGKATYEQIQAYVEEKTGLKVSSLYISQIKRKCGLEVGESFNKAKSDDARVPVCPPEKETAILEALKHFGMI